MTWFAIYVAAGALVGVLAGLLGIGGGMTLVPVLAALFTAQQFAPDRMGGISLQQRLQHVQPLARSPHAEMDLRQRDIRGLVRRMLRHELDQQPNRRIQVVTRRR